MTVFMRKVEIDGYKFDSDSEAKYYLLLKERLMKGGIKNLEIHPSYELLKGFKNSNGIYEKPINYIADFSFYDCDINRLRVIDIKGWIGQDDSFPLHRKLFDFEHLGDKLSLEVVKYSKSTGFVPYEAYKRLKRQTVSKLRKEKTMAVRKSERMAYVMRETALLSSKESKTPQEKARLTRLSKEKARLLS